jgi:hypothetical protein
MCRVEPSADNAHLPLGLGISSYPQCTITLSAGTRLLLLPPMTSRKR